MRTTELLQEGCSWGIWWGWGVIQHSPKGIPTSTDKRKHSGSSYHVPEEWVEGNRQDGCNEVRISHIHIAEDPRHGCHIHLRGERQLMGVRVPAEALSVVAKDGVLHPKSNALQELMNLQTNSSHALGSLGSHGAW